MVGSPSQIHPEVSERSQKNLYSQQKMWKIPQINSYRVYNSPFYSTFLWKKQKCYLWNKPLHYNQKQMFHSAIRNMPPSFNRCRICLQCIYQFFRLVGESVTIAFTVMMTPISWGPKELGASLILFNFLVLGWPYRSFIRILGLFKDQKLFTRPSICLPDWSFWHWSFVLL